MTSSLAPCVWEVLVDGVVVVEKPTRKAAKNARRELRVPCAVIRRRVLDVDVKR